jgi:hypothetical protein
LSGFASELNRAAEDQELFDERRLTRVREGDIRKGPSPCDRIKMVHARVSLRKPALKLFGVVSQNDSPKTVY